MPPLFSLTCSVKLKLVDCSCQNTLFAIALTTHNYLMIAHKVIRVMLEHEDIMLVKLEILGLFVASHGFASSTALDLLPKWYDFLNFGEPFQCNA